MDRLQLLGQLESYETSFEEEFLFIPRFQSLLRNFKGCFSRSLTTGHITASAWIINEKVTSALLVHHRKLGKWLQPGGHTDGQEDVLASAMREAIEETGLTSISLAQNHIFDLDIHPIPPHGEVAAHLHYDIRFLFVADNSIPVAISRESHDVRWFDLDQIAELTDNNVSIERMVLKSRRSF